MVRPKQSAPTKTALRRRARDFPGHAEFRRRAVLFTALAIAFLVVSLGLGIIGYRFIAGLGWVDAFFNATMILTGMGPAAEMPDDAAKLFASAYAIFGGAAYPVITAIVLYPFVHRMLKVLHLESRYGQDDDTGSD